MYMYNRLGKLCCRKKLLFMYDPSHRITSIKKKQFDFCGKPGCLTVLACLENLFWIATSRFSIFRSAKFGFSYSVAGEYKLSADFYI